MTGPLLFLAAVVAWLWCVRRAARKAIRPLPPGTAQGTAQDLTVEDFAEAGFRECDHGVSLTVECRACDPFINVVRIDSKRWR